jgi:signal transduction histidine kinase
VRVSLSDVTRAAVESTREAAETKNVRVEIVCGKSRVEGHPGDLTRLLRNLVENAIRHSPPGGSGANRNALGLWERLHAVE